MSRGELVEIGGGFRIPEIVAESGARLVEVGTTNRTRLADYRRAVEMADPPVGLILKVHPSNYLIEGFTASVGVSDLAGLGVLVVGDIGSGLLRPNPILPEEPDAEGVAEAAERPTDDSPEPTTPPDVSADAETEDDDDRIHQRFRRRRCRCCRS